MTRRARLLLEAIGVYVATIGLLKLLYELRFVPLFQQYLWTAAMLLQVYVPAWILHRRNQPLSTFGLHTKHWDDSLKLWFWICLAILPPSIIGHHLWQSYNNRHIEEKTNPYAQFPTWLRGAPPPAKDRDEVQIYTPSRHPTLLIRWQDAVKGTLVSDGLIRAVGGAQWVHGTTKEGKILAFSGARNGAPLRLQVYGRNVSIRLKRHQQDVARQDIRYGPQRHILSKHFLLRDFNWIWHLIIIQVLMVALPEEFFYRGFLLTRLDSVWPVKHVFGIPISLGNLVTSVLFALTHFLIGHQVYRLGVFFPSLLFGALKQRTGSLLAPILVHAAANITMKLLEVWYV